MLSFCQAPLLPIWRHDGLSPCTVDLIASSALLLWALFISTPPCITYQNRFRQQKSIQLGGKRQLCILLSITLVILPCSTIALFIVRSVNNAGIVGVDLLRAFGCSVSALLVFAPLSRAITSQLAIIGYSVLFLLYQCAKISSWNSPEWFRSFPECLLFGIDFLSAWATLLISLRLVSSIGVDRAEPKRPVPTDSDPSKGSVFSGLASKVRFVLPYVWPKKSRALQARVLFCALLIATNRIVNLLVPLYSKKIIDALTIGAFPVQLILVFVLLRFMKNGLFGQIRSFLWIVVMQYTARELALDFFAHLHNLSLQWHFGRRTGEILRILDRATWSINKLLRIVAFQICPTVADVLIAIVFFVTEFSAWFALIVTLAMLLYVAATIAVTEWRAKFQRRMNVADNEARTIAVDSLLNFETVKYYNAERYEVDRYCERFVKFQTHQWYALSSWTLLTTTQNVIVNAGLLIGSLYAAYLVSRQQFTVGDYVLFATYITQLYGPLSQFGNYYRLLQQSLIDLENMMALMQERTEVTDARDAIDLPFSNSPEIRFDNVFFSYVPERMILRGVSFTVPPGKTYALVGPTGSGKSTVIRLLFRFYDVTDGAVLFNGLDVRTVTQRSLRQSIGVVPQDTVLFNSSIRDNIRYGRVDASDWEVEAAAGASDMHDRIVNLPQGYDTVVGERGLKLSGGEKQRLCIARTILKNPQLLMLDEATSALDSETERFIQSSLDRVSAGRTTLVVAHRLSTVVDADRILVMCNGEIVEQGSHQELLLSNPDGHYASLWNEQRREGSPTDSEEVGRVEPRVSPL